MRKTHLYGILGLELTESCVGFGVECLHLVYFM